MLENFLDYIFKNYGKTKYNTINFIRNDDFLECIFIRLDNDFYLSQITFWDNFMYSSQIYDLQSDKYLLDENIYLNNTNEMEIKLDNFIKILSNLDSQDI